MSLGSTANTVELAKSRDKAISEMINQMENKNPGHKRLFQKLPNHLRRRAMSYDIKKVPRTMRPMVETQVNGAADAKERNKPKGRDPRKFRIHGTNLCMHRNEKHRWLESHIWHAKRFHIIEKWGWKIPYAPTMKQTRSIIKQVSESCCVRDVSYYVVVSIVGESINERITQMIADGAHLEMSERILFTNDIFLPGQYPNKCIGPVDFYRISDKHLWIICHPLQVESIKQCFDGFEVQIFDGEMNIFQLYGPRSTEVIRQSLFPSSETPEDVQATLFSMQGPGSVPPGFSFAYIASDPRTVEDDLAFEGNQELAHDIISESHPELSNTPLFENKNIDFPTDEEFNRARSKLLFPKAEGPSGSIPVLMLQKFAPNPHAFGASWLLISPFGCGNVFFRKIIHHGARAIGLEAANHIELESSQFAFPFDRPDTEAGIMEYKSDIEDLEKKNNARPPSKRIRLNCFQFPENFIMKAADEENCFSRVNIICVKRGTPSRFADICAPLPEDYLKAGTIDEIKGERRVIGVVTGGKNSLLAGEGKGLGYISSHEFFSVLPAEEERVGFSFKEIPEDARLALIREIGSQFYHPVWITIHFSTPV